MFAFALDEQVDVKAFAFDGMVAFVWVFGKRIQKRHTTDTKATRYTIGLWSCYTVGFQRLKMYESWFNPPWQSHI